jgi:alpha-galactosidase
LRKAVNAGRVPPDDLVRAELFRRFGYYPTESSEHHAEYNPWFIPKDDLVGHFNIPIGEYLDRVANNLAEYEDTKRRLDAGEAFEIERSGEYAAVIAHARATGDTARIVGNVMNHDGLIPNIAADACVEVPCDVDGSGVRPVRTGPLPSHCAAYVHPAVDTQALTVRAALDQDRDAIYHAVLCDPQVQARLTLDEAWRMTDALIDAEARWLPTWLGGAA